jgi:DNA-binding NarL/FixJ family response regulator
MPTTVAIIEDNPEFLLHFSTVVRSAPDLEWVGAASDGMQGRALIAATPADVYLIDLGLPDMDGTELIRLACATHPDCEVIVVTMFADDTHILDSIEAGATGYFLKDSAAGEIVDCIRTLVAGGAPVSPLIARKILQRLRQGPVTAAMAAPQAAGLAAAAGAVNGARTGTDTGPNAGTTAVSAPALLTEREVQILGLLGKGLSYGEIGATLFISAHTVAQHIKNIYRKLAVHSRGEAVYAASRLGLLAL